MKYVNKISIISSDKKEKIINIKEGRRYWLDEEMDYACIEILKEDNLSNYLSVFNDINDEKYQNKYIEKQLLYASNTNRISQGKGKMTPKYLLYNIVTYDGWSGSPIFLNEDNKVIGIHMAKNDMSKDKKDNQIIKNEKVVNIGIPIKNVLIHMKEMGEGNAK
jgi:hypothetical protein